MKTIYRTLMNEALKEPLGELRGRILDIASGKDPSYRKYLRASETEIVSGDMKATGGTILDFNKTLPFAEGAFDAVLFVNAAYIADDPVFTLREMHRVLKTNGTLVLVTPFVFPENREPHDYVRWTSEGIEKLCLNAEFSSVAVSPLGGHFTSALYIIETILHFRFIRWIAQMACRGLDSLVPKRYREAHPCPVCYVTICKK